MGKERDFSFGASGDEGENIFYRTFRFCGDTLRETFTRVQGGWIRMVENLDTPGDGEGSEFVADEDKDW